MDYGKDGDLYTFELAGHSYEVLPHGPEDGAKISLKLLRLGIEPLGALLAEVTRTEELLARVLQDAGVGKLSIDDSLDELVKYAVGLDFGEVGSHLSACLRELTPDDLRSILTQTIRDGQPLSNKQAYRQAFTRGYMELYQAVYHVCAINAFFPGLGI